MSNFEREDMELKAIMGEKFQDMSEAKQAPTTQKKAAQKPAQKPTEEKSVDEEWHPVKPRSFMDSLKDCAKNALLFGGLNMLIWYWMVAGLMDESIALPSMIVCALLCGWGCGRSVRTQ